MLVIKRWIAACVASFALAWRTCLRKPGLTLPSLAILPLLVLLGRYCGGTGSSANTVRIYITYGWQLTTFSASIFPLFTGIGMGSLPFRKRWVFLEWTAPSPYPARICGTAMALIMWYALLLSAQTFMHYSHLSRQQSRYPNERVYQTRTLLRPDAEAINTYLDQKKSERLAEISRSTNGENRRSWTKQLQNYFLYQRVTAEPHQIVTWPFNIVPNGEINMAVSNMTLRLQLVASSNPLRIGTGCCYVSYADVDVRQQWPVTLQPGHLFEVDMALRHTVQSINSLTFSNQSALTLLFDPVTGCELFIDRKDGWPSNILRTLLLYLLWAAAWCWTGLTLGVIFSKYTAMITGTALFILSVMGSIIRQLAMDNETVLPPWMTRIQQVFWMAADAFKPPPATSHLLDGQWIDASLLWSTFLSCGVTIPCSGLFIILIFLRYREICSTTHFKNYEQA